MNRYRTCLVAAALMAAPGLAQVPAAQAPDPSLAGTIRLTPQQREAALAQGAANATPEIDDVPAPDGRMHGEMGVAVGTGGYRSAYGSSVVPLGGSGAAAFSFQTDRFGGSDRRPRR